VKIEIPFLGGLLLGTDLLTRVTVQGAEQALFSTLLEYGWKAIASGARFLPEKYLNIKISRMTTAGAR
jgi:hypothetical protein